MTIGTDTTASTRKLVVRVDGAARGNPGPAGIGGVIENQDGQLLNEISEYVGETTNNVAEYLSLINALKEATAYQAESVTIYSDSELLIRQLKGQYRVKNDGLKLLVSEVKIMLDGYRDVALTCVPRDENRRADELANKAIDDFLAGEKSKKEILDLPKQGELF